METTIRVWRKLTSAKWADAWQERLRFLGEQRLAFDFLPSGKSMRIEAYNLTDKEIKLLLKAFGGEEKSMKASQWLVAPIEETPPLLIRSELVVVHSEKMLDTVRKDYPTRQHLFIPGGIAFGTGEHATTASCLRLLADFAKQHKNTPWTHLDLGTGSGILALAAVVLGAKSSLGTDFDPHAVRTAKTNAKTNQIKHVKFELSDVLEWSPPAPFSLVTANLFSEVLIKAQPTIIRALAPGATLILSGILQSQCEEVLKKFSSHKKLRHLTTIKKGKWCTLQFQLH